jgi:Uncharacterized alpha/beta hydrolase domain (DUF2235)
MTRSSSSANSEKAGPATRQPRAALASSAAASETLRAPIDPTPRAPVGPPTPAQQAAAIDARLGDRCPTHTCKLVLKIAFFFDGTGNNLDADEGVDAHSNVARLFKAHPDNLQSEGIYAFYIPGLGTYFRQINDIGDDDGMAFGKYGDARLDKAMQWLKETVAQHPADKIVEIKISLFGFSRGAALARAFARRVDAICDDGGGEKLWPSVKRPCSIYFMGIFDTVASVGAPASTSSLTVWIAKKWEPLDKGLDERRAGALGTGLNDIAFGRQAGADPTQAVYDGHMGWARNLRLPNIVKKLTHLMAMNEIRNSFPADTVWDGTAQPVGAAEMVYPGAHSNIGGGYRPGVAGKSLSGSFLLSKLPLRKMYDDAKMSGVPLLSLEDPRIRTDFDYDLALTERFDAACNATGWKHANLGAAILAHMRTYYRWRFRKIRLKLAAQQRGERIDEEREAARAEQLFARDAKGNGTNEGLEARVSRLENDPARLAAQKNVEIRKTAYINAVQNNPSADHEQERLAFEAAKNHFEEVNDPYLRERAKLRALPSHDGELLKGLDAYDRHLLKDVATLKSLIKERAAAGDNTPLRPHFRNLLETHDDEFVHGRGLNAERDKLIIEFFDNFVHDSLAGFAKDATLPSDPRCYYIGGDSELRYANNQRVFGSSSIPA